MQAKSKQFQLKLNNGFWKTIPLLITAFYQIKLNLKIFFKKIEKSDNRYTISGTRQL